MNKIALVIGNGNYPESPLKNPTNDANSITDKLENLGFECLICKDASYQEMEKELKKFEKELDKYEIGLFFFAGHGMQIAGKNYLAAVNTDFETEPQAKHSSLSLDKVIEIMEQGLTQTNIIILDACRNNPYERRWRGGGEYRGLAPVYAPKGMIIAYATSPGQVAYDGQGQNGAYTSALLQHISTQDITIEELFKRIRRTLSASTMGRQISWEHTSLMGDFYFNYSILTNDLVHEYSNNALADNENIGSPKSPIKKIIRSLKSHDWNEQNPAISNLKRLDLACCEKDDLFILGRNLYQAGCGPSWSARDYLRDLSQELKKAGNLAAFHILNGILYEIYFDSQGKKRALFKAEQFESVFALEGDEDYSKSFDFIRQALKPYLKQLFYIPGTLKDISLDVTTVKVEVKQHAISGIFFEGENILYDDAGNSYFDPHKDDFLISKNLDVIKGIICENLCIPRARLRLNYAVEPDSDVLLFPYSFKLKKY